MKKLLLISVLISLCITAIAQDKQTEQSKSQTVEFLAKDGVLRIKEFSKLGSVGGAKFENLIITDVISGTKIGALRIETSYYSSIGTDTYIGTLDSDELDACIKSLTYIKEMIATTPPQTYTELEYSTKDGVSLGCYNQSDKKGSTWQIFVRTKKYTSRSAEYFSADNIDALISILEKANTEMSQKL